MDYFFWKEGIGSKLVEFAKEKSDAKFVWTLEKNDDAIRFYVSHGFKLNGKRQLEEGTPEFIVMLERDWNYETWTQKGEINGVSEVYV